MKAKRFLSILLTLVMVIGLLSSITLTAVAEETSGSCGDNVTWEYDANTKTLTISGSGEMYNTYTSASANLPPWMVNYKDSIENVVINEGVTKVGLWTFYNCTNLQRVIISDGVTTIEGRAFSNCPKLEEITLPSSIRTIDSYALIIVHP